ncbi:uncharacterized protein KZ484_019055 [Pholidichthys leucotaenia]
MAPECAHASCKNTAGKGSRFSFHRFPKNEERRRRWTHLMRRHKDWKPSQYDIVCSAHFREEDFDRTGQTVRLRDGVEPSVKVPKHLQVSTRKNSMRKKRKLESENCDTPGCSEDAAAASEGQDSSAAPSANVKQTAASKRQKLEPENHGTPGCSKDVAAASPSQHSSVMTSTNTRQTVKSKRPKLEPESHGTPSCSKDVASPSASQHSSAMIFHNYTVTSAETFKNRWLQAQSRIESLERQLANALKREKRSKIIIKSLTEDLKGIHKLCEDFQKQLDSYTDVPIHLFDNKLSYSEEQREFALTLHLCGPKAYEYLSTKIPLPSSSTLRRWMSSTDGSAGINRSVNDEAPQLDVPSLTESPLPY